MKKHNIFATAVDTSDNLIQACRSAAESVATQIDGDADLVLVFIAGHEADDIEQAIKPLAEITNAQHIIGCTCETAISGSTEYENQKAVSIWAAQLPNNQLLSMHLQFERNLDGGAIVGWPNESDGQWPEDCQLLTLSEPFDFPVDAMLERFNEDRPDVEIFGGIASGGFAPGQSRLILNGSIFTSGAVVVRICGPRCASSVVSQGCRPIGTPFVVTQSERNMIQSLGGEPALLQLKKIFDNLPTREQRMVQEGLHIGRVINEYQESFSYGDFLIRNVIGIDSETNAITVGEFVRAGQTIQFHIRDDQSADEEMHQLLEKETEKQAFQSALLFTCNGRGTRLFPEPHHDAQLLCEKLKSDSVSGFFAAGEIGPVSQRNFLHGFTASVVLFK